MESTEGIQTASLVPLMDARPRTRAELVAETGFARVTVCARLDSLLAVGLVTDVGHDVSAEGRPASRFAYNPGAR